MVKRYDCENYIADDNGDWVIYDDYEKLLEKHNYTCDRNVELQENIVGAVSKIKELEEEIKQLNVMLQFSRKPTEWRDNNT